MQWWIKIGSSGLNENQEKFMSSVSSLSSTGYFYQPNNTSAANPLMKGLQAVGSALESGNVSEAQSALANLQKQLQGNSQTSSNQPFGNNSQANSAYQNLVSSVQSGNISGAEKALTSLKTDLRKSKSSSTSGANQSGSSQANLGQAAEYLQSVGSALQSGNLSSALTALNAIQASSFGNNSQIGTDYQNLLNALQTGDLSSAQQAYVALSADLA